MLCESCGECYVDMIPSLSNIIQLLLRVHFVIAECCENGLLCILHGEAAKSQTSDSSSVWSNYQDWKMSLFAFFWANICFRFSSRFSAHHTRSFLEEMRTGISRVWYFMEVWASWHSEGITWREIFFVDVATRSRSVCQICREFTSISNISVKQKAYLKV